MSLAAVVVNQPLALFAQRFVACALAKVLGFDVVPGIAVRADVMVGLLDRVPRRLPHEIQLLFGLDKSLGEINRSEMPVSYHRDVGFLSLLSLTFFGFGQFFLPHGDNPPREVRHLLKRRFAGRLGRVWRFHFRGFPPRFSWRFRLASRRSGTEGLAGQVSVGEALVDNHSASLSEAERIVFLPQVEAESLLGDVAEHMERIDANVGALDRPLQQAPEVLQAVGVDRPIDVSNCVVNDAMPEVLSESVVAAPLVGVERRALLDVLMNLPVKLLGADVLYNSGMNGGRTLIVPALDDAQNGGLSANPSAVDFDDSLPLSLVHVLGETADKGFVSLDRTAHFLEALGLHSKADTAKHEPRGFLGDAQTPRHFVGADAVLGIGQHPDRGKPLVQPERRVLKDCPELNRELLAAGAAFPDPASLEEHRVGRVTVGAHDARRPAQELKELERDVRVSEITDRFAQSLGSTNLGHTESYTRSLGVSSILLP